MHGVRAGGCRNLEIVTADMNQFEPAKEASIAWFRWRCSSTCATTQLLLARVATG